MKKIGLVILGIIALFTVVLVSQSCSKKGELRLDEHNEISQIPKEGFVPDKETAIRIAEAVWIPIYGKEQIESEKPFEARLVNDVWHVNGTLPPHTVGGTAIAEISKRDGRIIGVIHEE